MAKLSEGDNAPERTGHNSEPPLGKEERTALRMHHVRQLINIASEIKPLLEERRKMRALAKADGFKLSEIDAALRIATMEDRDIFVEEIKELIEIAKDFGALPPGGQGNLFPDRRPATERAQDDGYVAGMEGKNPEPPQGVDTPGGQAWMKGWHAAQKVMRDALQAGMEKRNAEKAPADEEIEGDD